MAPAKDLRERAYQIFGAQFLDGLLEVNNAVSEPTETSFSLPQFARVRGFVSAPRERRTSRDAQFLFVNGRFVRDRLIGRALSEGYRSILPHGVYPVALLFIDVPLEEVDVNVHPAKTEVRFRRAAAVADAVREAVRAALASAGYAAGIRGIRREPREGGVPRGPRRARSGRGSSCRPPRWWPRAPLARRARWMAQIQREKTILRIAVSKLNRLAAGHARIDANVRQPVP